MAEALDREPSYEVLCRYLAALSVPNRLELLRKLQLPHALADIELGAVRSRGDLQAERALSRTGVQVHLAKLEELGLVQARAATREGRKVTEYVVNQARLFIIVEELRALSALRPALGPPPATAAGRVAADPAVLAMAPGPALVLVGGPLDGKAFHLEGVGPWRIGRSKARELALPYDPFVSMENTLVGRDAKGHWVEDIPNSKNGTQLNWRRLAVGERARLAPGDVVGVGRSALVFRAG